MPSQNIAEGFCSCGHWQVRIVLEKPLCDLTPRRCDCEYCRRDAVGRESDSDALVSDPGMKIALVGEALTIHQNGDRLAQFYRCHNCNDLLAVGRRINGVLRGAVNARLLGSLSQFGEATQVQPRLLTSDEKQQRWATLWGVLSGVKG